MLLPDLRIRNYRLFEEFEIERLARVNLVAGRNNTGKSSLLEAAYLVGRDLVPSALQDVLEVRGENGRRSVVYPLFYGYSLSPGLTVEVLSGERCVRLTIPEQEDIERLLEENDRLARLVDEEQSVLFMQIDCSRERLWWIPLLEEDGSVADQMVLRKASLSWREERRQAFLLAGSGSLYDDTRRFRDMRKLWDEISLTPQSGDIVEALQIVEPKVRGVDFLRAEDNVKVLLEGEKRPVLIGSVGDGVRHLLMIALLLVSARDGIVLIDEVDTGLHYTVLVDLWRLIFRTARRLNVQVLATTHSWDCIAAFSRAWDGVEESEGLYLRLDREVGRIRPVFYTAEELSIATRQRIEVR